MTHNAVVTTWDAYEGNTATQNSHRERHLEFWNFGTGLKTPTTTMYRLEKKISTGRVRTTTPQSRTLNVIDVFVLCE